MTSMNFFFNLKCTYSMVHVFQFSRWMHFRVLFNIEPPGKELINVIYIPRKEKDITMNE